ncbi:MAG: hypothetical protein Q9226_007384, partial [Calogaya cf. arnoldii]
MIITSLSSNQKDFFRMFYLYPAIFFLTASTDRATMPAMSLAAFDRARLHKDHYKDLEVAVRLARMQSTIDEFIILARKDKIGDVKTLDLFCDFVKSDDIWPLADSMVPEFRVLREEESPRRQGDFGYILQEFEQMGRIPRGISDQNALVGEYALMDHRHRLLVEVVTTGTRGRIAGAPVDPEIQERHHAITAKAKGIRALGTPAGASATNNPLERGAPGDTGQVRALAGAA